ncbi:MAG: MATE family efflux transporter [Candidatus Merdivicinus sp.]|jgi:putative MATE family efflux protein
MEISQHFNLPRLMRFTLPTVIMMLFTSIYSMVDGIFVSRFVGSDALSAINIVYPLIFMVTGVGIMFSTGGGAIVGRQLGEGKVEEARQNLTFICAATIIFGIVLSGICLLFLEPLVIFLGASERLLPYCIQYAQIMMLFATASMIQILFQMFFVTAGKPKTGMILTIGSGIANIFFDYLFIVVFKMGIVGAAFGTVASYLIGAVYSLWYFSRKRSSLFFVRPRWRPHVLVESMSNGASEMVSNIAASITTFLFNINVMKLAGEEGVSALTIVLYSQFLFTAVFIGFSNGAAPVVSYNYGSGNHKQLRHLLKLCLGIIGVFSLIMVLCSQFFAESLIAVFTKRGTDIFEMALHGFRIFSWNFLIAGLNIFASSFFTALSNGKISALISFLRTFALQAPAILLLPLIWKMDGIWMAIPIAELITIFLACFEIWHYRNQYHYL